MPKRILEDKLNVILQAASRFPNGGSIDEIGSVLTMPMPRRTLQRRLAQLVKQQQLTVEGRARGSRYRPNITVNAHFAIQASSSFDGRGEVYIPISSEGEIIKRAVRAPIQNRHPVGYHREFLDAYLPNTTFYLPVKTRQRLAELGHSPGEHPAGTYVRQIYDRLLIDLSWNSSRLEGNTYSLLETDRLLQRGEATEGKNAAETQMILNHKAAIELLVDQAEEVGFNRYTILNLHALLSDNLLRDPQACGRLRSIAVEISGTVFHPLAVPALIEECFQRILVAAEQITDPFEQAFFVMVQMPYLQPFEDVNKRVSRLAANISLIRRNLCPISFVDVPKQAYLDGMLGVYELNRVELLHDVFVWAYERSCARYSAVRQSLGEPDPFRLRYRVLVAEIIAEIVRGGMNKKTAAGYIKQRAKTDVPQEDRARFIEVVETEIMSLHDGNIVRYRLQLSQFQTWRQSWS